MSLHQVWKVETMTQTLADTLEALAAKATPGPWEVVADTRTDVCRTTKAEIEYLAGWNIESPDEEIIGCEGIIPGGAAEYNTNLIVALHNNLPAFIAALRERDEAVEVAMALNHALSLHTAYGCPVCPGDCSSANPPVMSCPTQAAVWAFRKFDALAKQEPSQ